MDPSIIAAFIGLIGVAGAGIPGYFALRSTRRLRRERATIDQQTVNIEQFNTYTSAMERRMTDKDHETALLTAELREANRLMRVMINHIDRLYSWSRRPTGQAPALPADLAAMPVFFNADRPEGGS